MEKGQKVWVWRDREGIQETTIKSIGRKYIRTNLDDRIKFDINTLREINGVGFGSFLILNLKEYQKDAYYAGLRWKIKRFDWDSIDRKSLDKIAEILKLSKEGEDK